MAEEKKKKGFKMPHLLFLLVGMMVVMVILTYIMPAGQFVEGVYTPMERNPINPGQALLYIYQGMVNSASVIAVLLCNGGAVGVALGTGALDRVVDGCIYKLRDKGAAVLVPTVFFLLAMLGGFGGSDALIAMVPVGVMCATKLRLDPISGAALGLMSTLTGFACRPGGSYQAQAIMEIPLYSGYNERIGILMLSSIVGAIFVTMYAMKVTRDPSKSALGNTEWVAELGEVKEMEEKKIAGKDLLITALFIGQFPVAIFLNLNMGLGQAAMPAVLIPVSIICGFINGYDGEKIGGLFSKGVAGMGFVAFVIGFAGAVSLVMKNGLIMDTIAYYACMPLANLSKGFAAIGISMVVTVLNFFIPSASAKVAALMPLVKPMADHLGLTGQVAVQAYLVGDGFCNIISPFLGWTIGGLAAAKVPFDKWVKWALPYVIIQLVIQWVILFFLTNIGWTGV